MNRSFRRSDWWIELGLVPFAAATVFGALWWSAFFADPDEEYGVLAVVLGVLWILVLGTIDAVRYRHRAVILLNLPFVLAVWAGWFTVYDIAMDDHGIVEACPVTGSHAYQVDPARGSAYWERAYALDCEYGDLITVTEPLNGPPANYDPDPYDYWGTEYDVFGSDSSDLDDMFDPETIEVRYDPRGVLEAHRTDQSSPGDDRLAPLAFILIAGGIAIRIAAARARNDRH
jgi:hypothetical protein